jgi:hypothetical protein
MPRIGGRLPILVRMLHFHLRLEVIDVRRLVSRRVLDVVVGSRLALLLVLMEGRMLRGIMVVLGKQ